MQTLQQIQQWPYYCEPIDFDIQYPNSSYSQQLVRITQNGINKFVAENFDVAEYFIEYATFPDISFNASSLNFKFTNMHITQADMPSPELWLHEETNQLFIEIDINTMALSFEFQLKQQIYPYISESGTGQIVLSDSYLKAFANFFPLYDDCYGRVGFSMDDFQLYIQNLNVQLNSENAWLYQGLIAILDNIVKEVFNTQLQQYFNDLFTDSVNNKMSNRYNVFLPFSRNQVPTPDQNLLDFKIYQQYGDISVVGTYCYYQHDSNTDYATCTGHIMELNEQYPLNIAKPTNYDMQFYFGTEVLKSMQYYFLQNETIKQIIQQCDQPQIVNTGVIYNCIDQNNQQLNLHLKFVIQPLEDEPIFVIMYLQLDYINQNQFTQQINDALLNVTTGINLQLSFNTDGCWPMYCQDQYISLHCQL